MVSISNLESVDNGDGHLWSFRKTEGGKWSVEGLDGVTATVSSGGSDKIVIEGFPYAWGADGTYKFTSAAGKCSLKSQDSATHHLQWPCVIPAISSAEATPTVEATPSAETTTYDVVEKVWQTRITIKGDDYMLDGRLFRPRAEGRFPLVVLAHGTCGKRCRKNYEQSRLAASARVFARSGYVAYTFNRIGYGNSDGYRGEAYRAFAGTQGCDTQNYGRAARRTGLQVRRVMESLSRAEFVDSGRVLAVGQSGGGLAVLGLTEGPQPHGHLSGLKGVVSTAGALGSGCAKGDYLGPGFFNHNMVSMYEEFGRVSKTPVLMVYAENDPRTARAGSWRAAYSQGGGKAKLVALPEQGSSPKDGHQFFYKSWSTEAWKPHFNEFLSSLGLPTLK